MKDPNERLIQAVIDQDLKAAKKRINDGDNVNVRTDDNKTLMELALLNSDTPMALLLLDNHFNFKARTQSEESMVCLAYRLGNKVVTRRLILVEKMDVNADGGDLLSDALKAHDREFAFFLLDNGADPESWTGQFWNSPTMLIAGQDDVEMFKRFMDKGLKLEVVTESEKTRYNALINNSGPKVKELLYAYYAKKVASQPLRGQEKFQPINTITKTTFNEVKGLQHAKEELTRDVILPLKNPDLAKSFGISPGGGILLYGPPGCGKTFIVKALAGETGINLMQVEISKVIDKWVGTEAKAIKQIFETARKSKPCIILFDEFDGMGMARESTGQATWMRDLVNAILAEFDEITSSNEGIVVIGATNRPWAIDPALKRHGRMGKFIFIPAPDMDARIEIFKMNLECRPNAPKNPNYKLFAETIGNCAAGDIKAVCEEAAKLAFMDSVKNGVRHITNDDVIISIKKEKYNISEWYASAGRCITLEDKALYKDLIEDMQRLAIGQKLRNFST